VGPAGHGARGVVVILSDGWERGDVALLGEQMARLARLAHRVVWANPRKAARGYEPAGRRDGRGPAARRRLPQRPQLAALEGGCVEGAVVEQATEVLAGGAAGRSPTASPTTRRWRWA
jgi:hypothetical protein